MSNNHGGKLTETRIMRELNNAGPCVMPIEILAARTEMSVPQLQSTLEDMEGVQVKDGEVILNLWQALVDVMDEMHSHPNTPISVDEHCKRNNVGVNMARTIMTYIESHGRGSVHRDMIKRTVTFVMYKMLFTEEDIVAFFESKVTNILPIESLLRVYQGKVPLMQAIEESHVFEVMQSKRGTLHVLFLPWLKCTDYQSSFSQWREIRQRTSLKTPIEVRAEKMPGLIALQPSRWMPKSWYKISGKIIKSRFKYKKKLK